MTTVGTMLHLVLDRGYFARKRMIREFMEVIDEAEAHAQYGVEGQGESESSNDFSRGYLMGLCMGAATAGMPKHVWASPERHARQKPTQRDDDYSVEAINRTTEEDS